jgi:CelD/BcsL family acetyltransferase involved in cellulose biosynthesis
VTVPASSSGERNGWRRLTDQGDQQQRPAGSVDHLLLDPSDEKWMAFVASSPQANAFHHAAWVNLLAECYGYRPFVIAVSDAGGNIQAGLPIMEVRSPLTGRRWVSLPFTDYCAPLYRDVESLSQLTDDLVHLSQEAGAPRVELRWEFPKHPAFHSYSHYVLHTVELDPDPTLVSKRLTSVHRQNIRTAEKRGVRIECGDQQVHLQEFYRLQLQTRHRQGIPVQPRRFFDLLASNIVDQGLGFVLLAYKDHECIAAAVFLHWRQTLTCKYAASRADSLELRPNNLLFWTGIQWGCENGYTLFDMGRTDLANTGLRRFKRDWGAEELPLAYSMLSGTPPRSASGKLTPIMQTVISKSPVWVCRAAGELLYRHFG